MVRVRDLMGAFSRGRARSPARIRYPTPGNRIPGACPEKNPHPGYAGNHPQQQESIRLTSVTGICPGSLPCRPGVRVFRWPGSVLGVDSVPGTRDLRPAPRDERAQQPHRAVIGPSLVYPSDRNGAVRIVETTFRHFQSTFSPRSVHFQSTWGSTYVATWTPWRSTSKGVTKGMVERVGGRVGR